MRPRSGESGLPATLTTLVSAAASLVAHEFVQHGNLLWMDSELSHGRTMPRLGQDAINHFYKIWIGPVDTPEHVDGNTHPAVLGSHRR